MSEHQKPIEKLQIYPKSNAGVTPFWRGFSKFNFLADIDYVF